MSARLDRAFLEEKNLIGRMTYAVYDAQFTRLLRDMPWSTWVTTQDGFRCREKYLEMYHGWIASSRLNKIRGLDRFKHRDLINGTTQTFDEAYQKYAGRRLRLFRGEYSYHRRVDIRWAYLEDAPLEPNDYVIMSAPFCSTGTVPAGAKELFDQALQLQVPVIIDCAYFGTCESLDLDVSHPAIESVSFSLTKGLGLGDIRSGIRYSDIEDMNPIRQQNHYNHTVLAAARIGLYMMENLSPDFIPEKYSALQKQVCKELGLEPTPCMHLALSSHSDWDEYLVDNRYRRVGIRNLLKARLKGEI